MSLSDSVRKLDHILEIAARAERLVADKKVDFEKNGPLLTTAFLTRQLEYGASIKLLVDKKMYPSAAIIARTMLEGSASLFWALRTRLDGDADLEEQEKRAGRWRGFISVEEKKFIEEKEKYGSPIDPETKRRVTEQFDKYGKSFSNEPKNFYNGWKLGDDGKPVNVIEYFQEELSKEMREQPIKLYRSLSAFIHWSPWAFNLMYGDKGGYRAICGLTELIQRSLWLVFH